MYVSVLTNSLTGPRIRCRVASLSLSFLLSTRRSSRRRPAFSCSRSRTRLRLLHGIDELLGQGRSPDHLMVIAFPVQLQFDVGHLVESSAGRQREGALQSRDIGIHRENVDPEIGIANRLRC